MNNYWLNNRPLEKIIANHKLNDNESHYLAKHFYKLAERVCNYFPQVGDRDDAIQECMMVAWQKMNRYDPQKGKAVNFFTTIMLGHLRQIYRSAKNYEELKRKYLNLSSSSHRVTY